MRMLCRRLIPCLAFFAAACNNGSNPGNTIGIEQLPDLVVTDIEVSQGTQNLDNDMPLVANRWTMVRVYVDDANGEGVDAVSARLNGFRTCPAPGCPPNVIGQQPLPTLTPFNQNKGNLVNVPAEGGSRVNLEHSFWFVLPPSWRQHASTIEIVAEVDPGDTINEAQDNNNSASVEVRFHGSETLNLRAVPVHVHLQWNMNNTERLYDCSEPDFWKIFYNMFRYHPLAHMLVSCPDEPLEPFPHEIATVDIQPNEFDMGDSQRCGDVHSRLKWLKAQENLNGEWYYVGMIPSGLGSTCNSWAGAANGDASWLLMRSLTEPDPQQWLIKGGQTLAHELGHSRLPNPDHIHCKGNEGPPNGQADTEYPYPFPNCRFSANDANPGGTLNTSAGPPPASPAAAGMIDTSGELLLISGRVNTTTGAGTILQVALQPGAAVFQHVVDDANRKLAEQAATGAARRFALEVLDDTGNVLYQVPITVDEVVEEGIDVNEKWFAFVELLEFPAGASTVRLNDTQSRTELDSRMSSPGTPAVRFTSLTAGDTLDAGDTIAWSASDADGDELRYTLRYSPDGTTWHVIALDEPGPGWQLNSIADLPGSTAGILEVVASDGFNTASDVFGGVIVAGKPPRIAINSPAADAIVTGDGPMILAASIDITYGSTGAQ